MQSVLLKWENKRIPQCHVTGAIDAHKFGALGGGMAEGQIQMLGASLDDLVRPAKNSWGGRGSRDQLAAQNPCRIITLGGLGPLKKN